MGQPVVIYILCFWWRPGFCGDGFQLDAATGECEPCAVGFFKNNSDATSGGRYANCSQCSNGLVTNTIGSTSHADCAFGKTTLHCCSRTMYFNIRNLILIPASCLSGSFRDIFSNSCQICPRGFYQPQAQQTSCLPCPEQTTTTVEGATTDSSCIRTFNKMPFEALRKDFMHRILSSYSKILLCDNFF